MADALTTMQAQISAQLNSINTTLASNTLTGSIRSNLSASANTLQQLLDKLLLGYTLTDADQVALSNSLDTSQKAMLAAKANETQLMVFGLAALFIVSTIIFIIVRHQKKKSS